MQMISKLRLAWAIMMCVPCAVALAWLGAGALEEIRCCDYDEEREHDGLDCQPPQRRGLSMQATQ